MWSLLFTLVAAYGCVQAAATYSYDYYSDYAYEYDSPLDLTVDATDGMTLTANITALRSNAEWVKVVRD